MLGEKWGLVLFSFLSASLLVNCLHKLSTEGEECSAGIAHFRNRLELFYLRRMKNLFRRTMKDLFRRTMMNLFLAISRYLMHIHRQTLFQIKWNQVKYSRLEPDLRSTWRWTPLALNCRDQLRSTEKVFLGYKGRLKWLQRQNPWPCRLAWGSQWYTGKDVSKVTKNFT